MSGSNQGCRMPPSYWEQLLNSSFSSTQLYLPINYFLPRIASCCVVSCSMFVKCTKQVVHFTACMPVTPPYSVFTAERDEEARQREYLTSCPLTSCCYCASYMYYIKHRRTVDMPNSDPRTEVRYLAYQPPFYGSYYTSSGCDVTAHHYGENSPVSAAVRRRPFCRLICHISNLSVHI